MASNQQDKDTFNQELDKIRKEGVTLPKHPYRALESYGSGMTTNRALGEAVSRDIGGLSASLGKKITVDTYDSPDVQRMIAHNDAMSRAMGASRGMTKGSSLSKTGQQRATAQDSRWYSGFTPKTGAKTSSFGGSNSPMGGDVYNAIPRFYDPLEYWDISGLPWNVADEGHRHKLHKWLRLYYATHYLVPILIDIFTRFPLVGLEIQSKDPAITAIYEDIFLNQLDYEEFLVSLGREFFLVGEAFPLGSFDEDLGVWEHEELINPEDVVIDNFPLLDSQQLKIVPPDYLRRIAQTKSPAREWYMLQQNYEELIPYLLKGEHIPISPVMLTQVANTLNDWDDHGTPMLLRGLRTLLHEEKLMASQDAIAERLYSPFLLAKLGIMDMGDGLPPWIPGPDELQSVRDDIDIAMAADFRVMVHHFGLEMTSVFGRENMPRLGDDFDRIERRLMQCLSGDTLVHTDCGLQPIHDLTGTQTKVLSDDGVYRSAQWDCYGKQRIYQLILENGDVLEATAGHEWIVNMQNGRKKRFTTIDMAGRRIPMQYLADDFVYEESEWLEGAQHGLVYGDGWVYLNGKYTMVRQHGENAHLIVDLFKDNCSRHKINHTSSGYADAAQSLPNHWKDLPTGQESPSYLRGFIAGFIASDGSVDDTGHIEIAQGSRNVLQKVRKLAKKALLPTIAIQDVTENARKHNPKFPEDSEFFELSFMKAGFWLSNGKGIDPHLILKESHRELANNCATSRQRFSVEVVAVVPTDRIEEVYCCVEPETHSFIIENMYLTGNCFGINPSLLSAGSNSQPYASSALQAEFMNQMLRTYQNMLKKHFQFRAGVVAEAQGHFEYERKGQSRVPIYENVVDYDEDGNKVIDRKNKLLIPSLTFATMDLRDEATERQFLMGLRGAGLPIPDDKLMVGVSWKNDDYIGQYNRDIMKKTIAQQRVKMDTYIALVIQGLPVPMDLKYEVESVLQGGTGPEGAPAPPGGQAGGAPPAAGAPGGPGAGGGPESDLGSQMPSPPPGLGGQGGVPGGGPPAASPITGPAGGNAPDISNERRQGLDYNTPIKSSVNEIDRSNWSDDMHKRAKTIGDSIEMFGEFVPGAFDEEPKIAATINNEPEETDDPATWILASNQKIAEHNGETVIYENSKKRFNPPIEASKKYSIIDGLAESLDEIESKSAGSTSDQE